MKKHVELDLYKLHNLSVKFVNYKKIIKDRLNFLLTECKTKITKGYLYLKYSYKYSKLLKKVAKENNLVIDINSSNMKTIFKNNNLNEIITDNSKTTSIIFSHLFCARKIEGRNISTISGNNPKLGNEFNTGFILKRYSHDKGYRYLKYLKFYDINGYEFRLDVSNEKIKITDIKEFYYQSMFNTIVIIGEKLTYGDKINNNHVIKIFTLEHNVVNYFDLAEYKTGSYYVAKKIISLNNFIEIDTIDVSKLKELKDIRNVKIELSYDGINIFEYDDRPKGDSRFSIDMFSKNGDKVYLTKKYLNIKYRSDERIVKDLTGEINFIDKTKQPTINPFSKLSSLKINNDININYEYIVSDKVSKLRRELKEEIDKKEDKHIERPNLFNCLKNTINDYFNPVKNIKDTVSQKTESNDNNEIDFKSLGICNNNYNRNFIPFN